MHEDFNFYLPLAKVEKQTDGSCLVAGYASTPSLDLDGESISLDAVKKALPAYWEWRNVREMHQPSAVGVAKEAHVDEKGLFLTARIVDPLAVQKVLDQVYKGYSIGGRKLAKKGNTITEIELVEVSLVDRPCNPDCKIEIAKRAKDVEAEKAAGFLLKVAKAKKDPLTKAVALIASAAESLAKREPPAAQDGFSLAAKVACKAHGKMDCEDCAKEELDKREVGSKERKALASKDQANPDGSFPIKDKEDLKNAIQAFGRSKDKAKTKKLILRRAEELGATDLVPEKWSKKEAKKEARASALALSKASLLDLPGASAQPSFLSLEKVSAEPGDLEVRELRADSFELGELSPNSGNDGLEKGMGTVGEMSYAFDTLRRVQRSLMFEAKREGGDRKDAKLASQVGQVAQDLATIIGQKATHEGSEALDLSDAEDMGLNFGEEVLAMNGQNTDLSKSVFENMILDVVKRATEPSRAQRLAMARTNMKKAGSARKELKECIKSAHNVLKASYLAKAAKKDKGKEDEDEDASEKAMKMLQKAYTALGKLGTYSKAAKEQLDKAARSGQRGQETNDPVPGVYTPPAGIKDLSPDEMAGARGDKPGSTGKPPEYSTDGRPYPGKMAKYLDASGRMSPEVAELLIERSVAEALGGQGRQRPASFNMSKLAGDGGQGQGHKVHPLHKAIMDSGVEPSLLTPPPDTENEDNPIAKTARASVVGTYLLEGANAKSIIDPGFKGRVGIAS